MIKKLRTVLNVLGMLICFAPLAQCAQLENVERELLRQNVRHNEIVRFFYSEKDNLPSLEGNAIVMFFCNAAKNGDTETMKKYLLTPGIDRNMFCSSEMPEGPHHLTLLGVAIRAHQIDTAVYLADWINPHAGLSALFLTARYIKDEPSLRKLVRALVRQGADPYVNQRADIDDYYAYNAFVEAAKIKDGSIINNSLFLDILLEELAAAGRPANNPVVLNVYEEFDGGNSAIRNINDFAENSGISGILRSKGLTFAPKLVKAPPFQWY